MIEIVENPFVDFNQVNSGTSSSAAIASSNLKTP
jgi:hypothetical protein